MKTLIQIQEQHIENLLNATPYSTRNEMHGRTFMCLKSMTLRGLRNQYMRAAEKLGYYGDNAVSTMRDAEDMAMLERNSG